MRSENKDLIESNEDKSLVIATMRDYCKRNDGATFSYAGFVDFVDKRRKERETQQGGDPMRVDPPPAQVDKATA